MSPMPKSAKRAAAAREILELISQNPDAAKYAVIRESALPMFDGLGKTQRNEKIKNQEYPPPFPISESGRAKAWFLSEIIAWQEERRCRRNEKLKKAAS